MHSTLLTIFAVLSVAACTVSAADRKNDDGYENDWDYGYDDTAADYDYGYGHPEYEHKREYPQHTPDYPEYKPEYPTYKPEQPTYKPEYPTSARQTNVTHPVTTSYAPSTRTEIYPIAVTATTNQTRTHTATNTAYSTCYETAYAYICNTGMCEKTYTVTEHCPSACPTYRPSTYIPQHFTTTVTVCNHCGPQPTSVTLTYMPTLAPNPSTRRENTTTSTRVQTNTLTFTSRLATTSASCGYDCPPTNVPTYAPSTMTYKPAVNTTKSAMPTYTGAVDTDCPPTNAPTYAPSTMTYKPAVNTTKSAMPTYTGAADTDCPPTNVPTYAPSTMTYKPAVNTTKSAVPTYTGAANTVGVGSAVVAGVLAAAAMLL